MNKYKQLTIFDLFPQTKPLELGQWVTRHGARVMFNDLVPGKIYVNEVGAPEYLRVVRVTRKTDTLVFITDGTPLADAGHMMDGKEGKFYELR